MDRVTPFQNSRITSPPSSPQLAQDMRSRRLSFLSPSAQSAALGVALTVAACALFAVLDSATKFSGQLLPVLKVLWLRFLAQACVTSALVLPRHGFGALETQHLKFQLLRAIAGLLTTVCAFFCIQSMPLANFTAIWSAAPLFIVVASALIFKERVSTARWALLVMGLLAVIAIVRPENDGHSLGLSALWPVGLLICGTAYQVLGSRLSRLDSPFHHPDLLHLATHLADHALGWLGMTAHRPLANICCSCGHGALQRHWPPDAAAGLHICHTGHRSAFSLQSDRLCHADGLTVLWANA